MPANEFTEYAEECMGWARIARSDKERVSFLEMAKAWLEAAALAEQPNSTLANEPMPPTHSLSTGIEQRTKD